MTRRTPGRTAGLDNRRSTRSPSFPSRNTPAMGGNDPDRYRLSGMRPCGGLVTVTKYGPDPVGWLGGDAGGWPGLAQLAAHDDGQVVTEAECFVPVVGDVRGRDFQL